MNPKQRLQESRLILVTDPRPDLTDRVAAALRGGVDIVQLRDKRAAREELLPLARELKELCDRAGALFTVNDDIRLARLSGTAGVHLGQEDDPVSLARDVLGRDAVVGRSAGTLEEALAAVEEGADYLGAGSVYPTPTKPDADVPGLEFIRELARQDIPVPWFAIGGVTLKTAEEVAAAGAPGFAVVRAVLDAADPEAAARELRSCLEG
ncbi:thiamine phosphate synthase [Rubrobacter taiwanensis]|jgi:thiamine-phosphate pyrophosphorylase|uniref:Thiamine-phosphate synthase n=1 Tax=Rubrobacter taiwanensis TaxID=185139 RepID=A0A4R1BL64_9ACTN|nr:thiamine phosphate synthase [Rubrobacter taiwanensis]TCJ18076.1 thiamine phosphate synthase [Rubrobacter taiwanensis]